MSLQIYANFRIFKNFHTKKCNEIFKNRKGGSKAVWTFSKKHPNWRSQAPLISGKQTNSAHHAHRMCITHTVPVGCALEKLCALDLNFAHSLPHIKCALYYRNWPQRMCILRKCELWMCNCVFCTLFTLAECRMCSQ